MSLYFSSFTNSRIIIIIIYGTVMLRVGERNSVRKSVLADHSVKSSNFSTLLLVLFVQYDKYFFHFEPDLLVILHEASLS